MGDPADISDISDVTGVEKDCGVDKVYGEEFKTMVENTARELTSPFITGFFQGFFSVAKQYRREKKMEAEAAKLRAEQQQQQDVFQHAAAAAELNEGNVWIGVGAQEPAQ